MFAWSDDARGRMLKRAGVTERQLTEARQVIRALSAAIEADR